MFLRNLSEENKRKYLELAYKIATYDGEYAETEKELMEAYKTETGIDNIENSMDISELIKYFSNESELIQKIVWFELFSMINADYKITSEEEEISQIVKKYFTITQEKMQDIEDVVFLMHRAYKLAINSLFGE